MKSEEQIVLDRVHKCYDDLVDETENPMTLHDRQKNQRLNDLLELFEYLLGTYAGTEIDKNPLDEWFRID